MFDIALLIWVVPGTAGLWFYNRFTARQYYQLEGWEYLFAVMFFATPYYGAVEKVSALVHSPPLEGWQAKPDGVVVVVLH